MYNQIFEIPLNFFNKLNQLEELNLQFNELSYVNSSHFEGLFNLKFLDLSIFVIILMFIYTCLRFHIYVFLCSS